MNILIRLVSVSFICLLPLNACASTKETPKEQFNRLKTEYLMKRAEGFDVGDVETLFPEIGQAIQEKDLVRIRALLEETERRLKQATTKPSSDEIKREDGQDISAPLPDCESIFGVGYVVLEPGYAELYSKTGITWIKLPELRWQYIEPNPPKNGQHNYQWTLLDRVVKEYQAYGFNIIPVLRAKSEWASKPLADTRIDQPGAGGGIATTAPKDEHWNDYADWVAAVVERYDGDGVDDMPDLKLPILYYEIESEAQHHGAWQGTVEEYMKLLEVAYNAAKGVNKETQIILSGINFGDMFDDMPDQQTIDSRISLIEKRGRNDLDIIKTTLQKGTYDIVEFHYNRDWKGVYGTVDFIKEYSTKPIWAGDATSAPWLIASGEFTPLYDEKTDKKLYDMIVAGERETMEQYGRILAGKNKAVDWYRAEQAKLTTKKFVAAAEAGLERVIMETTNQWAIPARGATYFWLNWHIQNMVDKDKNPLPVFHTLKILVDKLDCYSSVERFNIGNNIYCCKFTVNNNPVFVLWYDDGIRRKPGDPEAATIVDISPVLGKTTAQITHIITEIGQTAPKTETKDVKNLLLTEIPIFIE